MAKYTPTPPNQIFNDEITPLLCEQVSNGENSQTVSFREAINSTIQQIKNFDDTCGNIEPEFIRVILERYIAIDVVESLLNQAGLTLSG